MLERWLVASIDFAACMNNKQNIFHFLLTRQDFIYLEDFLRTWSLPPLSFAGRELQSSDVRQSYARAIASARMPISAPPHSCHPAPKSFVDLPVELIDHIFTELDYFIDNLSLALTCWHCLRIAEKHLRKRVEAYTGRWAGDRIVSVGDRLQAGNLPPQLRTADVETALMWDDGRPISLYNHAAACFSHTKYCYSAHRRYNVCDSIWVSRFTGVEKKIAYEINKQYSAPRRPIVLRNLSRRVYVRETALRRFNRYAREQRQWNVTLRTVLLSQTCWTELFNLTDYESLRHYRDRMDSLVHETDNPRTCSSDMISSEGHGRVTALIL